MSREPQLETVEPTKPPHSWISNAAFTRMTGVRYVCMDCGVGVLSKLDIPRSCPGKREASK